MIDIDKLLQDADDLMCQLTELRKAYEEMLDK